MEGVLYSEQGHRL